MLCCLSFHSHWVSRALWLLTCEPQPASTRHSVVVGRGRDTACEQPPKGLIRRSKQRGHSADIRPWTSHSLSLPFYAQRMTQPQQLMTLRRVCMCWLQVAAPAAAAAAAGGMTGAQPAAAYQQPVAVGGGLGSRPGSMGGAVPGLQVRVWACGFDVCWPHPVTNKCGFSVNCLWQLDGVSACLSYCCLCVARRPSRPTTGQQQLRQRTSLTSFSVWQAVSQSHPQPNSRRPVKLCLLRLSCCPRSVACLCTGCGAGGLPPRQHGRRRTLACRRRLHGRPGPSAC